VGRASPCGMSAMGHEQTSRNVRVMSVIRLKADIHQREWHVRLVPLTDIGSAVIDRARSRYKGEPAPRFPQDGLPALLGCMRYILRSTAIVGAGPELRHLRITFNGRGLLRGRGHVSRSSDEGTNGKGDKCTYRSQT
jgi:hypothetical protein